MHLTRYSDPSFLFQLKTLWPLPSDIYNSKVLHSFSFFASSSWVHLYFYLEIWWLKMNFITVLNLHFIQVFFGWLVRWLGGGAGWHIFLEMTEVPKYCFLPDSSLGPTPPSPSDKELKGHDSTYLQVSLSPLKCMASEHPQLCLGLHLRSATKVKASQGLVPTVVSVSGSCRYLWGPGRGIFPYKRTQGTLQARFTAPRSNPWFVGAL